MRNIQLNCEKRENQESQEKSVIISEKIVIYGKRIGAFCQIFAKGKCTRNRESIDYEKCVTILI